MRVEREEATPLLSAAASPPPPQSPTPFVSVSVPLQKITVRLKRCETFHLEIQVNIVLTGYV